MVNSAPILSVVSPVYQGELLVEPLVQRITAALASLHLPYEIVLVDDGSTDRTVEKIEALAHQFPAVTGLIFDKNYGQHTAILAGLQQAKGEWIVVMDCDGQDPPEQIPELYRKAQQGYDAVFAARNKSHDPGLKKFYSAFFYSVLKLFSGARLSGSTANFGIYSKKVIQAVLQLPQNPFFFPVAARKSSKQSDTLLVEHAPRIAGETTYTFSKALFLALHVLAGHSFLSAFTRGVPKQYTIKQIISKR